MYFKCVLVLNVGVTYVSLMCTPITTTLQLLSTTLVISISIIKLGSGKELKSIELKHIWAQKYLH